MKVFLYCIACFISLHTHAQVKQAYSPAQCHSHNDYEQLRPFYLAFENGFGSIEADIYLKEGKLLVAHDLKDLNDSRSLESLYLQPLEKVINKKTSLQLLIDIKTEAISTLDTLIAVLKTHPQIIHHKNMRIVISGNRPIPEKMKAYPSFIYFDGRLTEHYDEDALKKIALISDSFSRFSKWNGEGEMNSSEQKTIIELINKVHALKKPIRFWATPDTKNSWQFFMESGTDFINTDRIVELSQFLATSDK